ncbi:MAG: hypothetical protein ABSC23_03895 [Bryobacteraceae bacterium]|jgi:hypothetical protein
MDVAGELAKCRDTAHGLYLGVCGDPIVKSERVVTALLAARADALRESCTPYWAQHGPRPEYWLAEELMREVQNRRARGL